MKKNKIVAMIPARYEASRFPGKLMENLEGMPVICRTYFATKQTQLFDEVYVVTDSDIIYNEIIKHKGKAIKSIREYECGSDRIAEAIHKIDADIVVNVQGDEPFTSKKILAQLLAVFEDDAMKAIDLASIMTPISSKEEIANPNNVKVIVDNQSRAMYFSRSVIPYQRVDVGHTYFKHIGIYAFRKQALLDFEQLPMRSLEATEKLECLRFLEYGKTIKMVETQEKVIGIDTPEDLQKARDFLTSSTKN